MMEGNMFLVETFEITERLLNLSMAKARQNCEAIPPVF
jgi:hypothetical protein